MRVWDVTPTGHQCVQTMALPSQAHCVAASADGRKCVAGAANGSLYFYDVDPDTVYALMSLCICARTCVLYLLCTHCGHASDDVGGAAAGLTVPLHRDSVTNVAWANAQRCITSSLDRAVKLLDVDSGICLKTLTVSRAATASGLLTPETAVVGSSEGMMVLCDFRESAGMSRPVFLCLCVCSKVLRRNW